MNINQLQKQIEEVNLEAGRQLSLVADKLRQEKVIPFCDSRRVQFYSGMGGFGFRDEGTYDPTRKRWVGDKYEDERDMKSDGKWQTLYRLLNEPGGDIANGHSIGCCIEDYTPPGWKK